VGWVPGLAHLRRDQNFPEEGCSVRVLASALGQGPGNRRVRRTGPRLQGGPAVERVRRQEETRDYSPLLPVKNVQDTGNRMTNNPGSLHRNAGISARHIPPVLAFHVRIRHIVPISERSQGSSPESGRRSKNYIYTVDSRVIRLTQPLLPTSLLRPEYGRDPWACYSSGRRSVRASSITRKKQDRSPVWQAGPT